MTDEQHGIRSDEETRVIEAARALIIARASFIRMRTSKRHNGLEVAAARGRRDLAMDELSSAVEELEDAYARAKELDSERGGES